MPAIKADAKEFKNILKAFTTFSQMSYRKTPTVTFSLSPSFRMVMSTDHAFINAVPEKSEVIESSDNAYSFNPERLLKLAINGKEIEMSWENENSPLTIKCGRFVTNLSVAVKHPKFEYSPEKLKYYKVPIELMHCVAKYMAIPFSFYKAKRDMMPVQMIYKEGKFIAQADDKFSLAKLETDIDLEAEFDVKVPYYVLDTLYKGQSAKDLKESFVDIGAKDYSIFLRNQAISVFLTGLNDQMLDFDDTKSNFSRWQTSFDFNSKQFSSEIKPVLSLLPTKDKSGTYVELGVTSQGVSLQLSHQDVGNARSSNVEGVQNCFNEDANNKVLIRMHPQAFEDYTSLFDFDVGKFLANQQCVSYSGEQEFNFGKLKLEYLFPTVQV